MKLTSKLSRFVGGGLELIDPHGRARFMIILAGTTHGISKEQSEHLSWQLQALIETAGGLELADNDGEERSEGL